MARRMRRKELSAREVLEAHLAQIERVNPKVNAIITLVADQARARALELDEAAAHGNFAGPLHGLPIAHKDLAETKGIRTTFGSPLFKDYVPNFSTLLVERTQAAGAITIGKTNTPEFGAGSQTFNKVFGPTLNPWDLTKTCGGSTGGGAVALACGMMPIADGSDFGGSLRNPAAYCSIVGFRPSAGRVPNVPSIQGWSPLSVLGPMARNVQDLALYLSAIAGPDPRAPLSIPTPGSRFSESLQCETRGLRIAWCPNFAGLAFDPQVQEPMQAQRSKFVELGCVVEDVNDGKSPDFSGADEAFKTLRSLLFYQAFGALSAEQRSQVKSTVIGEIDRGAHLTGPEIAAAETLRSRLFSRIGEFMNNYDFLILPTAQLPPYPVEQEFPMEIAGQRMESYMDWMRSCYFISMAALPAISVPAGFTSEGLPVGLQIVGRHHADLSVLQLAHAFEQVSGVAGRRPPVVE